MDEECKFCHGKGYIIIGDYFTSLTTTRTLREREGCIARWLNGKKECLENWCEAEWCEFNIDYKKLENREWVD
jgi:hypothetical protein